MPQRTNDFQQLISRIETQLAGGQGRVTESLMIENDLGSLREIDTAIEANIGGHDIVIAAECRDSRRRVGVEWIEFLAGKYGNISKVHKVVAVSRSGFTRSAVDMARANRIDTYTLDEATRLDWPSVYLQLHGIEFQLASSFNFLEAHLDCEGLENAGDITSDDIANLSFYEGEAARFGTMQDVVEKLSRELTVEKVPPDVRHRPGQHKWKFDVIFPAGCFVMDSEGRKFNVRKLSLFVLWSADIVRVPLTARSYRGAAVVYGEGEGTETRVSITGSQLKDRPATLEVKVSGKPGDRVDD